MQLDSPGKEDNEPRANPALDGNTQSAFRCLQIALEAIE